MTGNAEELPLPDCSFDALVNIESSRNYGSMEHFLAETYRVLRPQGYLLFADLREQGAEEKLYHQFCASGFTVLEEQEITANVVRSLELDSARRLRLIRENVPRLAARAFALFAGVEGSSLYVSLRSRRTRYWRFLLQKKAGGS
jgi:SAM-dependent methyltransferase